MADNNKPAGKIKIFPITAVIWRNSGEKGNWYSFEIERAYKGKDGKWQTTNKYGEDHALIVAKVADLAHSEILNLRAADRDAAPQAAAEGGEQP